MNALKRFLCGMSRDELASAEVLQLFKSDRLCLRWRPDYSNKPEHVTLERFDLTTRAGDRALRDRLKTAAEQIRNAQAARSLNTIGY